MAWDPSSSDSLNRSHLPCQLYISVDREGKHDIGPERTGIYQTSSIRMFSRDSFAKSWGRVDIGMAAWVEQGHTRDDDGRRG